MSTRVIKTHEWGLESHAKILPQYLHIASTAVTTVHTGKDMK